VTHLPIPAAARTRRPRWVDPRLLTGLLLVLISVALGAKVVADTDQRVQVWSVTRDLGTNTPLHSADVRVRSVRLDETARAYVSAAQSPEGLVLTRPVGEGELLPVSAVAHHGAPDERRLSIQVPRVGASGLVRGDVVDVYAVRARAGGTQVGSPELVLRGVTVGDDVDRGSAGFGATGSDVGLTLLVDESDVATLIGAVAHGDVYVAQVPGASST
jgi:hypothetical protein